MQPAFLSLSLSNVYVIVALLRSFGMLCPLSWDARIRKLTVGVQGSGGNATFLRLRVERLLRLYALQHQLGSCVPGFLALPVV